MPVPELLKAPFIPVKHYHVVFKSIDGLLLFRDAAHYSVFLNRFYQFTNAAVENWAYCLLNNHAHFIVKVKALTEVIKNISEIDAAKQTISMKKLLADSNSESVFDEMLERQINSFMVSYVNYTKNKYGHNGGVFQKPFKRIAITADVHLQQAIIYVHANSVKHNIFKDYERYSYSSYASINKNAGMYCENEKVIDFFGGVDKFVALHAAQIKYYYDRGFPDSKLE
jgi:putative transposase